jgi:hypothetical protein
LLQVLLTNVAVGFGDWGGAALTADVLLEETVLSPSGSFVIATAGLLPTALLGGGVWEALIVGRVEALLGVRIGGVVFREAVGAVAPWLEPWLAGLEFEAGDLIHPEKKKAANIKRNTLPPRTLASVVGLMPCLQQSRAKLRDINVSPG